MIWLIVLALISGACLAGVVIALCVAASWEPPTDED